MSTIIEAYKAAKEGKVISLNGSQVIIVNDELRSVLTGNLITVTENTLDGWIIEEQKYDYEDHLLTEHDDCLWFWFKHNGVEWQFHKAQTFIDFIGYVYEVDKEIRIFRDPILYFNERSQVFSISYEKDCKIYRPIAVRFKK